MARKSVVWLDAGGGNCTCAGNGDEPFDALDHIVPECRDSAVVQAHDSKEETPGKLDERPTVSC